MARSSSGVGCLASASRHFSSSFSAPSGSTRTSKWCSPRFMRATTALSRETIALLLAALARLDGGLDVLGREQPEAALALRGGGGDGGDLQGVGVELALGAGVQRPEAELDGGLLRHALLVVLLQDVEGLGAAGADGGGGVLDEGARRVGLEEARARLVHPGPGGGRAAGGAAAELGAALLEVADLLDEDVDRDGLVVGDAVHLRLDAGAVHQGAGVGHEAGGGAADVGVDGEDLLDALRHDEAAGDALVDEQDDAGLGAHADGGGAAE